MSDPLQDRLQRHRPADLALAELRAATLPAGQGGRLAHVLLRDVPPAWRALLLSRTRRYGDRVPVGCTRIHPADWEVVLGRLGDDVRGAQAWAALARLVERGPAPDDLAGAPRLSP